MSGPGLKPHQRCNPRSYVTERDFRSWATGLCRSHAGELRQWSRRDELSVTALAIVAVLSVFRGLRGGPDGCGVQMTLAGWAELLGRSRRAVAYAFDQLDGAGWVRRRRRLVKVDWIDDSGKARARADIWGVAYLTKLGAVRIARRGETKRLVVKNGVSSRVLTCAGVVGSLLKTHRDEIRAIAPRVTDALRNCTPSTQWRKTLQLQPVEAGGALPVGSALSLRATGPPSSSDAGSTADRDRRAQWGGSRFRAEIERLWAQRLLTAATAWPENWRTADARGRAWLREQFDRDYRTELGRRLAAEVQQLGADSARTEAELAALREREAQARMTLGPASDAAQ